MSALAEHEPVGPISLNFRFWLGVPIGRRRRIAVIRMVSIIFQRLFWGASAQPPFPTTSGHWNSKRNCTV
jgi:hypothetical protein